jgi:hypothetical protein
LAVVQDTKNKDQNGSNQGPGQEAHLAPETPIIATTPGFLEAVQEGVFFFNITFV